MQIKGDHFFNGLWHRGKGDRFVSVNPATLEELADFHHADGEDVDAAVRSAKDAFHMWSRMTLDARMFALNKFVLALHEARDQFAETISLETGKPLWESELEVKAMLNKVPISIEAYQDRCLNLKINTESASQRTIFKPHGVVAVIGPFNLPGHLPHGHIVPALLAGNTCVFKPSELTPMVGYLYARLWEETGLPQGVFQLIQGGKETGMALSMHNSIKGLFFTGSAAAGRAIHHLFGGNPERILALEMGGNNPLVVGQVDDLRGAAYVIAQSAFLTAGQRCTCARRLILIENEQTAELMKTLVAMVQSIKVGRFDGTPVPFMGPVISLTAAEKIKRMYHDLLYRGGKEIIPLKAAKPDTMLYPALVDVTGVKGIPDEEIFGPVLQVIRVAGLEEAIDAANDTDFGLSAAILTRNQNDYRRFLQLSRAGIVNWNRPTNGASSKAPFGGIGKSGNHRPSAYFAVDYCSYPVATMESVNLTLPDRLHPGISADGT